MNMFKMMINNTSSRQRGLSLIEIQVALVIGLILTAGAIQLFIGNKTTYRTETALAQMQQVGRFALETMAKEIRMTGYTGCTSRENIQVTYSASDQPAYDLASANARIGGSDGQGNNWVPARPNLGNLLNNMVNQTDTLTIQRAGQCGAQLTASTKNSGDIPNIYTPNQCNFLQNEVVMLSDCTKMEVFQLAANVADNPTFQPMNPSSGTLTKKFDNTASVNKLIVNTFYIAPSQNDGNINALYMSNWTPDGTAGTPQPSDFTPIELADGVDDMQILYGVDTGGADAYADTYVTADQVQVVNPAPNAWDSVRSVRISLLLSSIDDNVTTQANPFQFNGANANTANDRRLRAVYSTTVSIRNRLE